MKRPRFDPSHACMTPQEKREVSLNMEVARLGRQVRRLIKIHKRKKLQPA